jgi:heterotetrameric sarcosine oxidase delta subunit
MLRIKCPHCGTRDETEFRYGGEAGRQRPTGALPEDWARYLFWRGSPAGQRKELWLHVSGCRRWLEVTRDTATNLIASAADSSPLAPSASESEVTR